MTLEINDVPERDQYEAREDGELLGVLVYHRTAGQISFDHVHVEPAARGLGIADAIVTFAFDDLADEPGTTVVPACPYVRRWVRKHPEHLSQVATRPRHEPPHPEHH